MTNTLSSAELGKRAAAAAALEMVKPGMKLGLGTGSTARWFVDLLGEKTKAGLDIIGVATSIATSEQAQRYGIPLKTLDQAGWLDLTVDGADEFDPELNLIKGGGGALLQEKIIATASDKVVIITDSNKQVPTLGLFPLPIEIIPFAWQTTCAIIEELLESFDVGRVENTLRKDHEEPFITDEKHLIVDFFLESIREPAELSAALNTIPGVVENGLFIGIADTILIGNSDGTVERFDAYDRKFDE